MARVNLQIKTQIKQDWFKSFTRTVQGCLKWPGSESSQPRLALIISTRYQGILVMDYKQKNKIWELQEGERLFFFLSQTSDMNMGSSLMQYNQILNHKAEPSVTSNEYDKEHIARFFYPIKHSWVKKKVNTFFDQIQFKNLIFYGFIICNLLMKKENQILILKLGLTQMYAPTCKLG